MVEAIKFIFTETVQVYIFESQNKFRREIAFQAQANIC